MRGKTSLVFARRAGISLYTNTSVQFHPLATISTLLKVAEAAETVSKEEADLVFSFAKEPADWYKVGV
jgi:orotate phosphoribosyltransferase